VQNRVVHAGGAAETSCCSRAQNFGRLRTAMIRLSAFSAGGAERQSPAPSCYPRRRQVRQ
jgi:hypothetical protein